MIFEKKDYYGAQYEVNRFKKLVPLKIDHAKSKEDDSVSGSRMSKLFSDDEYVENEEVRSTLSENYFTLLFDIIDGIICILKMKISKGLNIFKEISLRLESNTQNIVQHYGHYYKHITKLVFQFKFYSYYILR